MKLDLNEKESSIVERARGFATEILEPKARNRDRSAVFPVEELKELAKLGLLGVNVPACYGGAESGAVAYSLAMMEIARADASVAVAVAVTNMVAEVLCAWGSEEQRARYVPKVVDGRHICGSFALSEPQAGSDAAALSTSAVRCAAGYRLNGNKQWITSGTHAGLFVIWAKTDPAAGSRGISAFAVAKGTPGLVVGRAEEKMGLHGSSTVQLHLEDLEVGPEALLGKEGDGF
ncbi:MAG: acyl-CoA dehydrogenase family protein, partial [Pseudomonadota bacterium]